VYEVAKAAYDNRKTAIIAALSFLFLSHTGGIAFLFDLLLVLPQFGIDGYLTFLKTVHGPHQYYGTMAFTNSLVITPMQMATMMNSFHFMGLAFVLYFLLKKQAVPLALSLAILVVANPIIAIVGALTILLYFSLTMEKMEMFKQLAIIGLICLFVDSSYLLAAFGKVGVVGDSMLAKGDPSFWPGYFAAYLPLIIIAMGFFKEQEKGKEHALLLLCFALAALAGSVLLAKGPAYIATDFVLFYAVCCAYFFAAILHDVKKALPQLALALLLMIPTFLVVGSYSYYKIPLSAEDLAAAEWIKANTTQNSVFLASIDLKEKSNITSAEINSTNLSAYLPLQIDIHQYVPVFGKRLLYFGDPYILYVYGEDFRQPMKVHQQAFAEGKVCIALFGTTIDYVYVNDQNLFFAEPLPDCIIEKYRNANVRIYEVISS
jgi:hypothetical protein